MREILFRAKRKDNGEWAEGSYMPWYYSSRMGKTPAIFWNDDVLCKTYRTPVLPETAGQYTGLTDKNGTKVFEGDIITVNMVHIPKQTGIVEYHKDFFGVKFEGVEPTQHCIDYTMRDGEVEVIGNIHDNPELLEGGVQE